MSFNPSGYHLLVIENPSLDVLRAGQIQASDKGVDTWSISWAASSDNTINSVTTAMLASLNASNVPAEGSAGPNHMLLGIIQNVTELATFNLVGTGGAENMKWAMVNPVSQEFAGDASLFDKTSNDKLSLGKFFAASLASGVAGYMLGSSSKES